MKLDKHYFKKQISTEVLRNKITKLSDSIEPPEMTNKEKYIGKPLISILVVVFGFIIALSYFLGTSPILVIIGGIIAIVGIVLLFIGKKIRVNYISRIRSQFNAHQLIKEVYESSFDNIEFVGINTSGVSRYKTESRRVRTPKIPGDARVNLSRGEEMKVDGNTFIFVWNRWRWTRRIKTKDGYVTRTYYADQSYIFTPDGARDNLKELAFDLSQNAEFFKRNKKNEDLENDAFNKRFAYHYNDGVKVRMAYTPGTQEFLLENWPTRGVIIMEKVENSQLVYLTTPSETLGRSFVPYDFPIPFSSSKNRIVSAIASDLSKDMKYILSIVGLLKANYKLLK